MKISVKKKNVHSEILFTKIDKYIQSLRNVFSIDDTTYLLESFIMDEGIHYKLDQVNIIADERNNTMVDQKTGKFNIDIYYKHNNCFNVTQLYYTLQG